MFKKFLLATLLLTFIFSCKLPTSSNMAKGILERYPYWNVRIKDFKVRQGASALTVAQKKVAIRALALMKLAVNTKEFEDAVLATPDLFAQNSGVVEGGAYNITDAEKYTKPLDKRRLLQVIREANFAVSYIKSEEWGTFRGEMGWLSYAFHGYRDYGTGGYIWASYSRWNDNEVSWFASSAFHEHLHNLGFAHTGNVADVPYTVGSNIMNDIAGRILNGNLNSKYKSDLEELTNLYLKMYDDFLQGETTN